MESAKNKELELAFDFVQYTNRHIFLTGKAGTGKTTFLHNLKKLSPKRMIVVAPTGVAAINAGGVTIHSFFQLPFHPHIPAQYLHAAGKTPPEAPTFKLSREKINIIKGLDLVVIDEISMVRADLLDAVDLVLRKFRDRSKPFGGIQLLMIGDIQQLAPVVKDDDWEILGKYYDTAFFFSSLALRSSDYVTIELKHIYRQQDQIFIDLLNKIRDNRLDADALSQLNKRYIPDFAYDNTQGYITLTTHNAQAQIINDSKLQKLSGKTRTYNAIIDGDFPEYAYPTTSELILKTGAQIMFVKNDISRDKLFFNGKIGKITGFDEDKIIVQCPDEAGSISVEMAEWQNMKYSIDKESKEIIETAIGTFKQYPLKLAWAITIHKSQGLTFNKAIIDARAAFAHGQVYVALSRCRTLEGIVLSTPVSNRGIISNEAVSGFVKEIEQNPPDSQQLAESKRIYQQMLLFELFDFHGLLYSLNYLLKVLDENSQHILGSTQYISEAINMVKSELIEVSGKFEPQLNYLISLQEEIESNTALQERIQKACEYFENKLKAIHEIILECKVETDNKTIRKSITDASEKSKQEILIKLACLNKMKYGFNIKDYLESKAKTTLQVNTLPKDKTTSSKIPSDSTGISTHPILFTRLKAWRDKKARESKLPHYMILAQSTIASLASYVPQTPDALKKIKGMGKMKYMKFGDELLDLITQYCWENNIEHPMPVLGNNDADKKKKQDTKKFSLNMYREGKSIQEIAEDRMMSISTIEGHLAWFVGLGEIPVTDFVSPSTTELIAGYYRGNYRLSEIKLALGNSASWSEIKFVMKYMEYLEKNKESAGV